MLNAIIKLPMAINPSYLYPAENGTSGSNALACRNGIICRLLVYGVLHLRGIVSGGPEYVEAGIRVC